MNERLGHVYMYVYTVDVVESFLAMMVSFFLCRNMAEAYLWDVIDPLQVDERLILPPAQFYQLEWLSLNPV